MTTLLTAVTRRNGIKSKWLAVLPSTNEMLTVDAAGGVSSQTIPNATGVNTGDQTSVTGNAGTATALATARTIDSVSFDGTANILVIAPATVAATSKATPVDADVLPVADSAASNVLKKLTWANIKATLKTYFDSLYPSGSGTSSGTNSGDNATNTQYSGLVSNATHTGDATGATALTLATVNSNVGAFTNASVTVNAKGLVTAASSGSGGGITVGTTAISGGTSGRVLANSAGVVSEMTTTGSGTVLVLATSPTLVTPVIGAATGTSLALSGALSFTSNAIIAPTGSGFVALQTPDSTATGGNSRGNRAVDLQTIRSAAAEVASGTYSVVAGGYNKATATGGIALGENNVAGGGSYSVALGGYNTTIGTGGVAVGYFNSATYYGLASGNNANARLEGSRAHASGMFAANADAQFFRAIARCKTTTNSAVEMFVDGSAARITIPSGKVMSMVIKISGVKSTGATVAHYIRQYAIKNVGGTTSEVYAPVTIGTDNAAGTTIALTANDTNDALKIEVTGIAAETWRWVAVVEALEIAYGT